MISSECKPCIEGQEHSDDEGIRGGYNSGTDDERSNEAFANLRARSTSPMHTTASLNDQDYENNRENKRTRSAMSDTDTSGDEDQFVEDEVQEVGERVQREFLSCVFCFRCKFQFDQLVKLMLIQVKIVFWI